MKGIIETRLFPDVLRKLRKEKKLTQSQLANLVGVSLMSIKRYEGGDTLPDLNVLGLFCYALQNEEDLISAWVNSRSESRAQQGDSQIGPEKQEVLQSQVKDILQRQYWDEIIKGENWQLQYRLVEVAKAFSTMTLEGIIKAVEMVQLLSKIPEYHKEPEPVIISEDISGVKNECE